VSGTMTWAAMDVHARSTYAASLDVVTGELARQRFDTVVGTTATGRDASSDELRKALGSSYPGHPKLPIRTQDSGAHKPSRAARAAAPGAPAERVTCSRPPSRVASKLQIRLIAGLYRVEPAGIEPATSCLQRALAAATEVPR
jgi:hypothetical protein